MSLRSPLLVILSLAIVAGACEEFPEPLETDSSQIPISIQPVDWPAELAVGATETLEAEVVDQHGAVIQDVRVSWGMEEGSAGDLTGTGGDPLRTELYGNVLGWAYISMSVDQDPFVPTTRVDSVPILLAGVQISVPQADTTLTAVGQSLVLAAEGLAADSSAVSGAGLDWQVIGSGVINLVTTDLTNTDQVEVTAAAEGSVTFQVASSQCLSTAPCMDSVTVTVDQIADSVVVTPRADTLVAGDTVQLTANAFDANNNLAPTETMTWTSRNAAVATVDGSGRVVAQGTGQTWVVAASGTGVDSSRISVAPSGVISADLTDAPADLLQSARLYLNGVWVVDNLVTRGRRYLSQQSRSMELLALADTVAALAAGRLPAGTYNHLVLGVDSARIMLADSVSFGDGSRVRSFKVAGDSIAAAINGAATFTDGDTIRVVMDFDVDGSFPMPDPDGGVVDTVTFQPTTRTIKRTEAASMGGSVSTLSTPSVADLTLRAVRTDLGGDTLYARTDGAGAYQFRYVVPGSYDITMPRPPACHVPNPSVLSVAPTAGQAVTGQNLSLDPVTIDSVATSPATDTINAIGFTTQLAAVAYQGMTPLTSLRVDWSSADPAIATVNSGGLVTGVASGNARIIAAACGSVDTAVVTVRQVPALMSITPEVAQVEAGGTRQFTATLADSAGVAIDTATIDWFSDGADIATVDSTGLATGVKSGSVQIIAIHPASNITGYASLSVLLAPTQNFSLNSNNGCALTTTNQVACWGPNPHGILGFAPNTGDWATAYGPQTIPLPTNETYTQVATGTAHACALTTNGTIYCWGSGGNGELGNGSFFDTHTPVQVQQPSGELFTDVTAGDWFTCAATQSGQAYCWGQSDVGQLGNGSTTESNVPVAVDQSSLGISLFDVEAENRTVCAIGTNGLAACWGEGHVGQLGDGGNFDSYTPSAVSMPPVGSFTQIAMFRYGGCGLGTDNIPYCWGQNTGGAIDGTSDWGATMPVTAVGTETFTQIGRSDETLCGVTTSNTVRCTGNNGAFTFGNGTSNTSTALWENGATGVTASALDGGSYGTMCALDVGGDVWCWGSVGVGLVGTGQSESTATPLQTSVTNAVDVTGRAGHFCALTGSGDVYCWGRDVYYFTNGAYQDASTPVPAVAPPAGVLFKNISLGNGHLCALTDAGQVYCLGANWSGQLGDGTFNWSQNGWVLAQHPTGGNWTEMAAGNDHTCARDNASAIYCWGSDNQGQLGDGDSGTDKPSPTQVSDVGVAWASLTMGGAHTCATTTASDLFCWGYGGEGQLGNASYANFSTPQEVAASTFFGYVTASSGNTCALNLSNQAFCWGNSDSGRIGDGSVASYPNTPQQVNGGFAYQSLYLAAWNTTCGIETDNSVKCWGGNWSGQYGNGTYDSFDTPTDAWDGFLLDDLAFTWGDAACGITTDGDIFCTGWHSYGATGVGIEAYARLPVLVGGSGGN